ncbi:MAG TPA: LysR family transcriptional regulator [Anaerolineae bacterium]|nr:LysR family transcriptional regulator [Anaerolineae bacterium]
MPLPPLTIHTNIWLETEDGDVALSRWRMELLENIHREGSISAAAKAMNIQYRLAWQRIHEMEERLGFPLVETTIGGRGGGGACLTPQAHLLLERLTELFAAIDACAQEQGTSHLRKLERALAEQNNP